MTRTGAGDCPSTSGPASSFTFLVLAPFPEGQPERVPDVLAGIGGAFHLNRTFATPVVAVLLAARPGVATAESQQGLASIGETTVHLSYAETKRVVSK